MSNTVDLSYPASTKNLLIKAGLLGQGKKVLRCKNLEIVGMEYSDSGEPLRPKTAVLDSAPGILHIMFKKGPDNWYVNDWRRGLSEDEIKRINTECNIPYPSSWYEDIMLQEGQELDLSLPYHMFLYLAAQGSSQLAVSADSMDVNTLFWFEDIEASENQIEENIKVFQKALDIVNVKCDSIEEKVKLLKLLHYRFNIVDTFHNGTKIQIERTLAEFLDDRERREMIVQAYNLESKEAYLMLYDAIEADVINITDDGTIKYRGGNEIATNMSDFIQKVTSSKELSKTIIERIKVQKSAPATVQPNEVAVSKRVMEYDLSYSSKDELFAWPIEALRQLCDKKKIEYTQNMSAEEIIKLIK